MKYCGFKNIDIENENKEIMHCIVPEIEGVRVKINPNPKDDTEFYIILD